MREVNPKVVEWALSWNELSIDQLAQADQWKFLQRLVQEGKQPTVKQLEKLAAKTHTLVPYFFMDSVPEVQLQIPDFRTQEGTSPEEPSPELFETIDEQLVRQSWLSDYFQDAGYDTLEFIGKYVNAGDVDPSEAASFLTSLLALEKGWASRLTYDEAVRTLRHAMEVCRISVSISGYAKNATTRVFDVAEFRGFVLSDSYAPMVFVNGRDAKVAQLFTLAHELAHLLFSQSGLVNDDGRIEPDDLKTERICDRIAAEFLAPADEFVRIWDAAGNQDKAIENACKYFKISFVTCTRRALEINLISETTFWQLYNQHASIRNQFEKPYSGSSNGGNPYNTWGSKLGAVFTEAVFTALKTNRLQYKDAYRLTGLKAKTFDTYFAKKGYAL